MNAFLIVFLATLCVSIKAQEDDDNSTIYGGKIINGRLAVPQPIHEEVGQDDDNSTIYGGKTMNGRLVVPQPIHEEVGQDDDNSTIYGGKTMNGRLAVPGPIPGEVGQDDDNSTIYGGKIINGRLASPEQIPFQVGLFYSINGRNMFCGGSLLNNEWVLTAGHCVYGGSNFQVILGATKAYDSENGKIVMNTRQALYHPRYDSNTLQNDVAVIQLASPVQFNQRIRSIRLPGRNDYIGGGVNVLTSGWGKLNDQMQSVQNDLYYVNLMSITNNQCRRTFGTFIRDYTVCTTGSDGRGVCSGDSGGPLWVVGADGVPTLVGVTSFVDTRGCQFGSPNGFSRTQAFLDFIRDNTGINV